MPLSDRQLAAFADEHAWQIPFDTSPRHLAGPGDARHVTHGLAAAGWSPVSDPLSAEIVLRSPDHRFRLQFDPQSDTSASPGTEVSMPPTPETVDVDFIAPRHLAGGGDPAWITVPLHRACGWSHGNDPLMPRVLLSSPDQKALLCLEPVPDGQWWALRHVPEPDRPAWYASFGARTPVELIAAFTDALTGPAADRADAEDPLEPLRNSGWSPFHSHNRLASADGTVHVEVNGTAGSWYVETALYRTRPPLWQARFGEHTPPHLISAFTTALTDPSPVPRTATLFSLPTQDPGLFTVTRREVPAVHVASALENRVRSLTARRCDPPASPSPPQRPPAKNSRSR